METNTDDFDFDIPEHEQEDVMTKMSEPQKSDEELFGGTFETAEEMQRSRQEKTKAEDSEKNENAEAKKSGGGKIFLIIAIVVAALALVYVILNKSAIFQKIVPESSKPSPQSPFKNSSGKFAVKNFHFGNSFKGNVGGEYVARLCPDSEDAGGGGPGGHRPWADGRAGALRRYAGYGGRRSGRAGVYHHH